MESMIVGEKFVGACYWL